MNEDITIVRAQIGLAFERIDGEGQWGPQSYISWMDVPITAEQRVGLLRSRDRMIARADHRNIKFAWRGVMTNTIVDGDLDTLMDLGQRMVKRPGRERVVIAHGNAFSGLALYGPFENASAAIEWAEGRSMRSDPWEVALLREP